MRSLPRSTGSKPPAHRRPLVALVVLVLTAAAVGVLPAGARAAATPVPTFTRVPTTPTSQPYGSTDADVANLAAFGYVQEEFFISGTAAGMPYTTRILVRRPASPRRFSGMVIAESIRSTAVRSMWSLRQYMMRSGHAYVEIGSNHLAVNNLLKPSDPTRYGPLNLPAIQGGVFGHVMEVMAQGGMLLRTNPAGGPFRGFDVEHVILAGCSEQGLIIRQYMRDAHPIYRAADGKSIFDGYFPACVADWPEQFILVNGQPFRNFTPGPIEVPVVNLAGQQEVESWPEFGRLYRRPDRNAPNDKYRIYEVAGMGHGTSPSSTTCAAGQQPSRFPAHHLSTSALDKLIRWVDKGIAPPTSEPLATAAPNGPLLKDVHGNALGGVRSVHVDVPVATFFTCVTLGTYEVPFTAETIRSLYRTPGHYVIKVNQRISRLVRDGWYLPPEALEARIESVVTALGWIRDGVFAPGATAAPG
jgi:Alpha/beta hydrolase domain